MPPESSDLGVAGALRGRPVSLVKCQTSDLQVPAEAEIVLEGYVSTSEVRDEGPYGDHTGHMNAVAPFPVFTITAMTRRRKPIYLSSARGHILDARITQARPAAVKIENASQMRYPIS